jgi:hypothetical protein
MAGFDTLDTTNDIRTKTGTASATTQTIVAPVNLQANDALIIAAANGGPTTWNATPITGGAGTAWAAMINAASSDDVFTLASIRKATAADVGATFTITATAACVVNVMAIRVPGALLTAAGAVFTRDQKNMTQAGTVDATTCQAPTVMAPLDIDLSIEIYFFSQHTQSTTLTINYPTAPTWQQLGTVKSVVSGASNFNSALMALGKLAGGKSGDTPQPTVGATGSWGVCGVAIAPWASGMLAA